MFNLFKDTSGLWLKWRKSNKKEKSLWDYYIYKKWMETFDGFEPDSAAEKTALCYLSDVTKTYELDSSDLKSCTHRMPEEMTVRWIQAIGVLEDMLLNELNCPVYAKIIFDFLETNFAGDAFRKDTDRDEESCLFRLIGMINEARTIYGLGKACRCDCSEEHDTYPSAEQLKPRDIKAYLDRFIIGQEEAKRTISTAVYAHSISISNPELKMPKNTVLLIGPSGCGKTEIMRRIRDLTGLPVVLTDVSGLGPSQYGRSHHIEDLLLMLLDAAGKDIELAQQGIVFMDEFDKLLTPMYDSGGSDLSMEMQGQLLTVLEGARIELTNYGKLISMDTSNILFILSGAFQGIDKSVRKIIMDTEKTSGDIGFKGILRTERSRKIKGEQINHEVLVEYGMKRELAGRISEVAVLEKLSTEALIQVMTEADDSILKHFKNEIRMICGAKTEINSDLIRRIAKDASEDETGARSLYGRLRLLFGDILYELAEKGKVNKVVINDYNSWETVA